MSMDDDIDQDALAAEWEAAAAADQPDFDAMDESDAAPAGGGMGDDGGDDLASEWEAMVGGDAEDMTPQGPGGGGGGQERILNQEEIDSLLGFSVSDDDGDERSGRCDLL